MATDVSEARGAFADALFGDTFEILRTPMIDDGAGGLTPDPAGPQLLGPYACGFGVNKLRSAEPGGDANIHLGSYVLKFDIDLVVLPSDQVVYRGTTYDVVWAPPISALSLKRKVGLEEAKE